MPLQNTYTLNLAANRLAAEDVSDIAIPLIPKETPLLAFLGGPNRFAARNILHEYVEDFMLPNFITASTAINSATAATAFQVNGLGEALTIGTILQNETSAEFVQVSSIIGPNSIAVTRNYDGSGIGSLAAGGQLRVLAHAGLEGADHRSDHTARMGVRRANTVGYYAIPFGTSGSQLQLTTYGSNSYDDALAKGIVQSLYMLENEIVAGVLNAANSLGTSTTFRTMRGLRSHLTSVNSTVTASSLAANPHLYLGDVFDAMYANGASPTENWAIVAGRTLYRSISNLNDTKVEDSQQTEDFKRVVRRYTGPFGSAEVILSRALGANEGLIVSQERVRPGTFRPWTRIPIAQTGDNQRDLVVGEFTLEVHHESALGRIRGI